MNGRTHSGGFSHQALDDLRLALSQAVARSCTPAQIRAKSLQNLERWKSQGCWGPAYDEWSGIARNEDDDALLAVLMGRDENAARLRQSMPYVGLLSKEEVRRLYEAAASGASS